MDFVKSESLLYIYIYICFPEKVDFSNLFLISRLVSDILNDQE